MLLLGDSVYGRKPVGTPGGWCCGGEVGGGKAGTPYGENRRSMPVIVLPVRAGLNPPAIGRYAGGGWVGTAWVDPDEENGRRLTPGIGEGSIGRVRGNTEADQRCGVRAGLASSPWRSVMGRNSLEEVARCMTVRRVCMAGWASAGIAGFSRCVV